MYCFEIWEMSWPSVIDFCVHLFVCTLDVVTFHLSIICSRICALNVYPSAPPNFVTFSYVIIWSNLSNIAPIHIYVSVFPEAFQQFLSSSLLFCPLSLCACTSVSFISSDTSVFWCAPLLWFLSLSCSLALTPNARPNHVYLKCWFLFPSNPLLFHRISIHSCECKW